MSQAASQAWAFYREVARLGRVWTIRDKRGIPAPLNPSGQRAMPFWSTLSRAERFIESVAEYRSFRPEEVSWEVFRDKWLVGLEADGLLAGVNWSGPRGVGFDLEPHEVRRNVEEELRRQDG